MKVMGIDPGLDGGIAMMYDTGMIDYYSKMPTVIYKMSDGKKKRSIDIAAIAGLLAKYEPDKVFIEKVHAMPGQGVTSMFNFGVGYGMILGLCLPLSSMISTTLVRPQEWQKFLLHDVRKDIEPKARAMAKFYTIWPEMQEAGVTHDGIVDALLICEYGRRMLNLN